MTYPEKVLDYLTNMDHKETIKITALREPNRFLCAVNYLVLTNKISNIDFGINDDYSVLKKY